MGNVKPEYGSAGFLLFKLMPEYLKLEYDEAIQTAAFF